MSKAASVVGGASFIADRRRARLPMVAFHSASYPVSGLDRIDVSAVNATREDFDRRIPEMDLHPVAIEFDFVKPALAVRHPFHCRRQSRFDEARKRPLTPPVGGFGRGYGIRSNQPKGQLTRPTGIAGNEVTDMLGDGVAFDVEAGLDFKGDIFRDVF
jgi:hypothetical protein